MVRLPVPIESIFADEAGDLGLKSPSHIQSKPYYVVGFVYCKDPRELRKRLRRILKRLHVQNIYPPHLTELKFYLPYTDLIQQGYTVAKLDTQYAIHLPNIRTRAIQAICKYANGVFAAVIDKRRAAATWTVETLGTLFSLRRSYQTS